MVPCQRAGSSDTEREVLTAVRTPCCAAYIWGPALWAVQQFSRRTRGSCRTRARLGIKARCFGFAGRRHARLDWCVTSSESHRSAGGVLSSICRKHPRRARSPQPTMFPRLRTGNVDSRDSFTACASLTAAAGRGSLQTSARILSTPNTWMRTAVQAWRGTPFQVAGTSLLNV
jgi:hypothetical protein